MDKEQLFNDGFGILQSKLENWFKNKKIEENDKTLFYIFLPKIEKDIQEGLKMMFPIYKKNSENNIELYSWIENSLDVNKSDEYKMIKKNELSSRPEEFFELKNHVELVKLFAQIFYLSMNLKKANVEAVGYKKSKEILYNTINEYNEKISDIYDVPKISSKENENITISRKQELSKFDEIVERLDKGNSENKKYDFEWKEKNGLRYLSDDVLEIALILIEKGKITLKYEEKEENAKIKITSIIESLCNENLTDVNLLQKLKANENEIEGIKIFNDEEKPRVFTQKIGTLGAVCTTKGCKFQKCPKAFAGYILYLKNSGLLREALEDRERFRKENQTNPYFDFEWNVQNGVKEVPGNIYEFCNELVSKNKVVVNNILDKNGNVKIQSLISCNDFKIINNDINKIPETNKEESWRSIIRPIETNIDLCSRYSCRLDSCPMFVAAYIYYMKKIGKEESLLEDRKYYEKNKKEIDAKIKENKTKKLEMLYSKKAEKIEGFKEYSGVVKNLDVALDSIVDKTKNKLHLIVSGNDENDKKELIDKLQNLLETEEKIKFTRRMSMQNFASLNFHVTDIGIMEKGDLYFADDLRDARNAPPSKIDEYEIPYKGKEAYRRNSLEKNSLYILDDVTEFLNEYKESQKNDVSAVTKKGLEHAIKLITEMSENTYIIINTTLNEVDKLLNLDFKLKFTYQDNIVEIPELSIHEMYELYLNKLKEEIAEEIKSDNEKYEKEFNEYISLNKFFVPFSNKEWTKYLASYTNSKGEAILPENIRKKEEIEETLENIVGQQNLKNKIKEFEKYMMFMTKAKANNLNIENENIHMIFAGNKGTGKKTIAKIMTKLLFDLGIIKENKIIITDGKKMMAKPSSIIEKALGGVLYIDETSQLAEASKNEAIEVLLEANEDYKNELVVIFADNKEKINEFTELKPYVDYIFEFEDYDVNQLVEIFEMKVIKSKMKLEEGARENILKTIESYMKLEKNENGIIVDEMFKEVLKKHALNDDGIIDVITAEEI